MTYIYRNNELYAIVDDDNEGIEALLLLQDCYPDDEWTAEKKKKGREEMKTQSKAILEYLQEGNEITPLVALSMFGCFRLGARVWDLRKQGHNITSEIVTIDNKHFASYKLEL